jgi:hypothetical protein
MLKEEEKKVKNDFLLEWFHKFHDNHFFLTSIYNFSKRDCLNNERYLAMLMHIAIPSEFESLVDSPLSCFDEMP